MCGIFSYISFSGDIDAERFTASLATIRHRGPDDSGHDLIRVPGSDCVVALGHTRLSIFDLSEAGHQPMSDEHGRWLIFNGEIFNWPELRAELSAAGHRFHTQTDSEVILAAYHQWGEDCVSRFNGFWAFMILDTGAHNIFVSRDRFGIKPLYMSRDDEGVFISSEISPIWHYQGQRPSVDLQQLSRYLVLDLSHDTGDTIYQGVVELEPGHNCRIDLATGVQSLARYWKLPEDVEYSQASDDEVLEEFTRLMEDSVRLRLRADREVALTLSGGIDSSVIAVAASRVSDARVKAFTSHFPGRPELDESGYAATVADRFGLDHVLVEPVMARLYENEQALTRHQELMYTSFSQLINWFVVQEIAASGTVVYLTGQGGDEVFIGYERYATSWISSLFKSNPVKAFKAMSDMVANSRLTWKEVIGFLVYFSNRQVRTSRYRSDSAGVFSQQIMDQINELAIDVPSDLATLQQIEVTGSQLRRLLRYDDRTSSAFGIEARPAFLDHRLAEFSARLGWEHKIRNGWTKYVLRRYLEKAGLPEIAWRKHKYGYAAPTQEWTDKLVLKAVDQLTRVSALDGILKPGLSYDDVPDRLRFKVYNLISTARALEWSND